MDDQMKSRSLLVEQVAQVVMAYVSRNKVAPSELAPLIASVHSAFVGPSTPSPQPEVRQEPAVPVKKSITPDAVICLEDGKAFKSLKRHLRSTYGLTPEQYRVKWGLPPDYPMVAPNYAARRSQLARDLGFGQRSNAGRPDDAE